MSERCRVINDHGIGYAGRDGEYVRDIRVYEENGSIQVSVEVAGRENAPGPVREAMQYLSFADAMAFSATFRRCAERAAVHNGLLTYEDGMPT